MPEGLARAAPILQTQAYHLLSCVQEYQHPCCLVTVPFVSSFVSVDPLPRYVTDPIFQVESVRKVSVASTSLCIWVHAVDVYAKVAREVAPKRQRLLEMNAALEAANAVLQEKQVRE